MLSDGLPSKGVTYAHMGDGCPNINGERCTVGLWRSQRDPSGASAIVERDDPHAHAVGSEDHVLDIVVFAAARDACIVSHSGTIERCPQGMSNEIP